MILTVSFWHNVNYMVCKAANICPGRTSSVIAVNLKNPRQASPAPHRVGSACQTCEHQAIFACKPSWVKCRQGRLSLCMNTGDLPAPWWGKSPPSIYFPTSWGHSLAWGALWIPPSFLWLPYLYLSVSCIYTQSLNMISCSWSRVGVAHQLGLSFTWVALCMLQGYGCAHRGLSVQTLPAGAPWAGCALDAVRGFPAVRSGAGCRWEKGRDALISLLLALKLAVFQCQGFVSRRHWVHL